MIEVVHTRVFAAGPGGGNPCPVVPDADALTDDAMQELARRFGLDTVFILRSGVADVRLRYFVPDHEMGVSGHATIAAVTVGAFPAERLRIETINGIFEVTKDDRGITLEQNRPEFGPPLPADDIAAALRVDANDIVGPIRSVSVSRPKLIIPLRDAGVLNALRPDFEKLWRVCEDTGVTGFYPFAPGPEARQFPLRAGFNEDAATGVAAAALAAYLTDAHQSGRHTFRIRQGVAMGAPSVIEAFADCEGGAIIGTGIRGSAAIDRREWI